MCKVIQGRKDKKQIAELEVHVAFIRQQSNLTTFVFNTFNDMSRLGLYGASRGFSEKHPYNLLNPYTG